MESFARKLDLQCTKDSLISPYLEGSLGPDKMRSYDLHLNNCEFCRFQYLEKLSAHRHLISTIPNKSLAESE